MTGNVRVSHLVQDSIFQDAGKLSKEDFINRHFDMMDIEFIQYVLIHGIPGVICYDPEEDVVYDGHKRVILAWLLDIETIQYAFGESQLLFEMDI